MTATLSATAANYTNGSCTYHLSLRSSTPSSGTWQNLRAAWFFITDGAGTILYYHHGLEFIHTALTAGQGAYAMIVCNDGTVEWATSTTLDVGSTFAWHKYVNASSGSSGGDGSAGDPFDTIETAIADLRASGVASTTADYMLELSNEAHTHSTVTSGNYVWNQNTQANGLGSAFAGRLTIRGAGSSCSVTVPGSDAAIINNVLDNSGFASINVNWIGDYTTGGGAHTGKAFNNFRSSPSGNGWNFTFAGGSVIGFDTAIDMQAPGGTADYDDVANGTFDWMSVQDAEFHDHYSYHIFAGGTRYMGIHRIFFGDLTGTGTGSSLRIGTGLHISVGECEWDRSGTSWKANCYRDNGGSGRLDCESQYQSLYALYFHDCYEGIEIEQVGASAGSYDGAVLADCWIMGCIFDLEDDGNDRYPIAVTSYTGETYDITNLRISACAGRTTRGGMSFLRMNNDSSATTNAVHSVRLDQCTMYQVGAYGFYGYSAVMASFAGANYDAASITLLGNYGYCAETATDFSHPVAMFDMGTLTPGTVIAESDYNVLAKYANSVDTKWFVDGTALADWDDGGEDTHSYELYNETAHNLTNVTTGSYDARPASGTGPQLSRGYPGAVYADSDRGLFDGSAPTCGAFQRSATAMPGPDLSGESGGGGGGSTLYPDTALSISIGIGI